MNINMYMCGIHGTIQSHILAGGLGFIVACVLVVLAIVALAVSGFRPGKKLCIAALIVLSTLTSTSIPAQSSKQHGVGWQAKPGSTVMYAFGLGMGSPCPRGSQRSLQPQYDPWAVAGDPQARLSGTPWTAPGLTPQQRIASRRAYGLLFGSKPVELDAGQECWQGGLGGGAPHGVGDVTTLIDWYNLQSISHKSKWDGIPNEREQEWLQSQGEWCRLLSAVGRNCRPPSNWLNVKLADLAPEFWIGADNVSSTGVVRKIKAYEWSGAAPAGSCTYWNSTSAYMAVRPPSEAPECWVGMLPTCGDVQSLRLECWNTEPTTPIPVCGDGECNGDESTTTCPTDCGSTSPPSTARMILQLCRNSQWEFTVDGEPKIVSAPGQVTIDGVSIDLPSCVDLNCPAAEILNRVKVEVCQ